MNAVYLSIAELELLKDKKIGSGGEADVYNVGNGILYKIYRSNEIGEIYPSDDSDIKIVSTRKDIITNNISSKFLNYYDNEGVKLYHKDAILKAVERQAKVQYTNLPKAPIFLKESGKLIGCVLKYHKRHYPLHSFSFLPLKIKLKIMRKVLRNVEELLNANIYHLDLANKKVSKLSHSNILLSLTLEPQIIDIDGRSAIYTESPEETLNVRDREGLIYKNEKLYTMTLNSFSSLLLDFLFDEDMVENDYDTEIDMEFLYRRLENSGLPRELSEELIGGKVSLEVLQKTLKMD